MELLREALAGVVGVGGGVAAAVGHGGAVARRVTPAGTLSYTYDAAGNVASIASSNTNGASMSYTYDGMNRLSTVVDNRLPSGSNTTTYVYDSASNVVTVTYPNGLVSTLAYDSVNRMTSLGTVTSGNAPVASYNYAPLGATGIKTQAAEAIATSSSADTRNVNWGYDNTYRLTSETIANDSSVNGAVNYTLDPVGNRSQETSSITGLPSVSLTFNANDLLTSGESYDANGNTTYTGGKTFGYDSQNQLISMNSGAVALVYDGDGNRVSKTISGTTTQYLVDDLNPTGYPQVIEEVVGGSVAREYTYGLQRISENQPLSGTWTVSFYGYDGGGSVRQLTNASGAVTDTYNYDAFGNQLNSTGSTLNNYLYRGEQYDSDLGLYYLRARYYNPMTGRFLSRDPEDGKPSDPKTLHKYLYAGGDPINGWDPSGLRAIPYPGSQAQPNRSTIEYATIVLTISIAAVPAVKALGCAVNMAYEYEGLRAAGGSGKAIKLDLPDCSAEKDCTPYEEAIQTAMEAVEYRYNELLMDTHNLYGCRNNKNPWTQWGSWWSHLEAYENAQTDLEEAIIAAIDAGCPVPPEAYVLLNRPAPSCPAN